MKTLPITIAAVLVAALAACDAPNISAPHLAALTPGGAQPKLTTTECYETIPATRVGSVPTDSSVIALNCGPETCGPSGGGQAVGVNVDVNGTLNDEVVIQCPNSSIYKMLSTNTCWDCVEGCGGSACPLGATCTTIPGQQGSDCIAYTCPVGWTLASNGVLQPPVCRRPCPPPVTVTIDGPLKIKPGEQCTWTATVGGGNGSYTYNWFREVEWVSGTASYTGGRPNGTLYPQFKLRVDVSSGSQSASAEILVKEDTKAMECAS